MGQVVKVRIDANTKQAQGSFKNFTSVIKKHKIAILAVGAAFVSIIKEAAEFEKQMADISNLLGNMSAKIMPGFSKGIKRMQIQFGESSKTLASGLFDIVSAGIDTGKALDVLEVSAKAAAAGLTDTGTAADAVTTILNSYRLATEEATRVSDILFATALRGKTNFATLAPNIGKVAATAAVAGLSLEELSASISTITRAGIQTEEAMTSVNGILQSFLKANQDAKTEARKFGLELSTNTLRTEGLLGVMKKLKTASAEQLALIFPNIRALKGIAAAMQDTEGFASDLALAFNSAGLAEEAFKKQAATTTTQINRLWQSIKFLAVELGDPLLKPIAAAASAIADLVLAAGLGGQIPISVPLTETQNIENLIARVRANAARSRERSARLNIVNPPSFKTPKGFGAGALDFGGRKPGAGMELGVGLTAGQAPGTSILPPQEFTGLADVFGNTAKTFKILGQNAEQFNQTIGFVFQDLFRGIISGTRTFGENLQSIFAAVMEGIVANLAQTAGESVGGFIFRAFAGVVTGGGSEVARAAGAAAGGSPSKAMGTTVVFNTLDAASFKTFMSKRANRDIVNDAIKSAMRLG